MSAEFDRACGRWVGRSEPLILGKYTQEEADRILDGPDTTERRVLQGEICLDIAAREDLDDAEMLNCALVEARLSLFPLVRAWEDLERKIAERQLPEYGI